MSKGFLIIVLAAFLAVTPPAAEAVVFVDVATNLLYIARELLDLPPVPASFRPGAPLIRPDAGVSAAVGLLLAGCPTGP